MMLRLTALLLLVPFLGGCSSEIKVAILDGPDTACQGQIPDGPSFKDMAKLESVLLSPGSSPNVVIYATPGTSEQCIAATKAAALRAGKRLEVRIGNV